MIEGRNIIIWFGEENPPTELGDLVAINGLEFIVVNNFLRIGTDLWRTKGLIIKGKPDFISNILRKVLLETGRHSVPIALINSGDADPKEQLLLRIMKSKSISKFLPDIENVRRARQYSNGEWAKIIKEFLEFKHGPRYSENLKVIKDDSIRKYDPYYLKDEFFIKRAFSDFEKIEISRLAGGHSGARVYRVTPVINKGRDGRTLPFLIKIDVPENIAQERDIIETFVSKTISFQHRPNLFPNLCFATPEMGVIVQDFIENAITLHRAIRQGRAAMLIASLFEDALQPWRLNTSMGNEDVLISYFFPDSKFKCCKDTRFLEEAYNWAVAEVNANLNPRDLFLKLKSCFSGGVSMGRIHGDLHCSNVFVGAGSHDMILIDFRTSAIGPTVSDPACLEIDIAFRSGCSLDFLRELYEPSLLPPPPPGRSNAFPWIWEAVRAIRLFGKVNRDDGAYAFAVAAHLLRFSSYEDNGPIEIRGTAYAIAEKIITSLCQ